MNNDAETIVLENDPCTKCGRLRCARAIGLGSPRCCACNRWTSCPNCFSGEAEDEDEDELYGSAN